MRPTPLHRLDGEARTNQDVSSALAATRVVWTVRARCKLEQLLAQKAARPEDRNPKMRAPDIDIDINTPLRHSFKGKEVTVIVEDLYVGFRPRTDRIVLLVEVADNENPGPWVVKLGPSVELEREWGAWEKCRPYGLKQDLVLMTLDPRPDDQGKLVSLVYGDAKQSIGVEVTCTLEEAITNATLYGSPTVLSVRFALIQLYERLGQLLHSVAYEDERNADLVGPNLEFPRLWASLQRWEDRFSKVDPRYLRKDLIPRELALAIRRRPGISDRPEFAYLDPVDYLAKFVKPFTSWRVQRREVEIIDEEDRSTVDIEFNSKARVLGGLHPTPSQLIPRFRRGRVHGDLHGRNVRVGIANGQAHWPSVFDFEDMRVDGLIGLDFVKLETELKIRILPLVFDRPSPGDDSLPFQEFEQSLNTWSEFAQSSEQWPKLEDLAGPIPVPRVPPASRGAVEGRGDGRAPGPAADDPARDPAARVGRPGHTRGPAGRLAAGVPVSPDVLRTDDGAVREPDRTGADQRIHRRRVRRRQAVRPLSAGWESLSRDQATPFRKERVS